METGRKPTTAIDARVSAGCCSSGLASSRHIARVFGGETATQHYGTCKALMLHETAVSQPRWVRLALRKGAKKSISSWLTRSASS